jgi:hypothetical protein
MTNSNTKKSDLAVVQQVLPEGVGLIVYKGNEQVKNQFDLNLKKGEEFDYTLKLANDSKSDIKLVLTAYLDYNQIEFDTTAPFMNIKQYPIDIKAKDSKDIPIKFKNNMTNTEGLHILNFILYQDNGNNGHSIEMISRYNLIVNNENLLTPKNITYLNSYSNDNKFVGIALNSSIVDNKISSQGLVTKAKPGETISIPIVAGGYPNTSQYLVWATLNQNQYKINDQNYIFLGIKQNEIISSNINVVAPKQKGSYELQAYIATTPWDKLSANMKGDLDTSYHKITLVVD